METIEMLKALYDFQAVYPKTISFDEGEYFILYQTSVRQRNWWQVVSMKGNIGFVPSNYVMTIKVEPDFLIGFLNSSIESLELSKDTEINGIIAKEELLDRLREKKTAIERFYSGDKEDSETSEIELKNASSPPSTSIQMGMQSPPQSKKLDCGKKSMSSPAVGTAVPPQMIQESPSMGVISQKTSEPPQQQDNRDNSITSEPSETTTTTTTTSEEVVTIYKESSSIAQTNGAGTDASEITECVPVDIKPVEDVASDEQSEKETINLSTHNHPHFQHHHNHPQQTDSDNEDSATAAAIIAASAAAAAGSDVKVDSGDVYQIVEVIRRSTNLSFDLSCEALRVVLTSLEQLYNGAINPYLEAVAVHVTDKVETPKELLGETHDSKRLQDIFCQLADCKNDSEQRTWMLYEDEDDIIQFLEELVDILENADENICCYEMSCDQYESLINMVQFYQMETSWPIKKLLLRAFTAACHLDKTIIDILLTSVLPLEIVEDMKTHFSNVPKFKELVKMLTTIFSQGERMPVAHDAFLGVDFSTFLLEIVEGNHPDILIDLVIYLLLSYNLQFELYYQNYVLQAMQKLQTVKVFTEKILLLLNREEDPLKSFRHALVTNSVLKMITDIFTIPETAMLVYTNDRIVVFDIVVRQLSDLCAGNPMRGKYLNLCRCMVRSTNYEKNQYRKQELMKIFTRIFCEETECSADDQKLVRAIANEFPHIFKAVLTTPIETYYNIPNFSFN
ncbi:NCK-interacting protein with SH3 domain [Episyrphus balteatus]|uniref:NCK-interacting protein with SH3 domain n=1 Tax=Episyrphus balteatus TaxID=286459 RepID=UPI00248507CB|nr:NCK-interacting protein with SH3 domain [Episyrphus balteatus]